MTSFWSTHDDTFGNVMFYLNDCTNQFKTLMPTVKQEPIDKIIHIIILNLCHLVLCSVISTH